MGAKPDCDNKYKFQISDFSSISSGRWEAGERWRRSGGKIQEMRWQQMRDGSRENGVAKEKMRQEMVPRETERLRQDDEKMSRQQTRNGDGENGAADEKMVETERMRQDEAADEETERMGLQKTR